MILQNNSNPLNSLYYIGYQFLSWLKVVDKRLFDIEELFFEFKNSTNSNLQFSKFLLLLDWLYVEDCLNINEKGEVEIHVFT
ncbi:MAG: hypothetical protein Q8J85_00585 [Sulfuricurvum sp.]|nr:hypothetical protein [Sulfuricurvum sp.]MDP3022671.1 hypothetical protein [Sulfuricurvum sp.]